MLYIDAMFMKVIALAFATLLRFAQGGDPINDPYDAAIVTAEVTGLNDRMRDTGHDGMPGATWLVATGMAESRLVNMHGRTHTRRGKKRLYAPHAIHKIDAWLGKGRYKWSVRNGRLRPDTCPFHRDDGRPEKRRWKPYAKWANRGPYGMVVADKFKLMSMWVGTDCFPVEWFDFPLFNAIAASEYAIATCNKWGKSRRRCDAKFLRCIWAGIGWCNDRPGFKGRVHRSITKWQRRARRKMRSEGDLPTYRRAADMPYSPPLPSPPPRPRGEW